VLTAAGALYALVSERRFVLANLVFSVTTLLAILTTSGTAWTLAPAMVVADAPPTTFALFLAGLKGGLLTFGGAYTAIPFVRDDTVGRGWMTDAQFLDGLALSGVLPAPLVIFATFVGYVCGGMPGALAITAGMFLPAFAFSLVFYERLEALAEHKALHAFLAGVAAGVLGLIAVTLLDLGRAGIERSPNLLLSAFIFAVGLTILYRGKSKLSTPLALAIGAGIGLAALT
jgi:chromate transporter